MKLRMRCFQLIRIIIGLFLTTLLCLCIASNNSSAGAENEEAWYDYSAFTKCKRHPEPPLYNGGIIKGRTSDLHTLESGRTLPAFLLSNLTPATRYCFSCWVKIRGGADSTLLKAKIKTAGDATVKCIGTSVAKRGCWSFLKGGFVFDAPAETPLIFFQNAEEEKTVEISVGSASLQPFTVEQWEKQQKASIRTKRKRTATIHTSDLAGNPIAGASVYVRQVSKDFPFGSAIAKSIIGNLEYQEWFAERFNAAVFENELKWYTTEPEPGRLNYTLADGLLRFVRSHQILARGHNIFWEDPKYTPEWVRRLSPADLRLAIAGRIQSLFSRYRGDFAHWDVSNEMLHFDFYESRLADKDASLKFFKAAQEADPAATLFMNEFNVVEGCDDGDDERSTVDSYVARMEELVRGGAILGGVGLEGHFGKPNVVLTRAVLDKLSTLDLPIWLTEVDIRRNFGYEMQAKYLEEVLREGFSYPRINGIILWTALHPNQTCYEMCLTGDDFHNLPAGDVVDRLLKEWETGDIVGETDDHGLYSFDGFLGTYNVSVSYRNRRAETTIFLNSGQETKHFNLQF